MQQNPLSAVMPKAGFICIIIREIPCFFGADIDQRQVFAYRFGKTPQRSIESHTIFSSNLLNHSPHWDVSSFCPLFQICSFIVIDINAINNTLTCTAGPTWFGFDTNINRPSGTLDLKLHTTYSTCCRRAHT